GLLQVRDRAAAPDDVPALRGAGGDLLRVDRHADASAEEPRRSTGGGRELDRPGLALAEVQTGVAPVEPPPVPPDVVARGAGGAPVDRASPAPQVCRPRARPAVRSALVALLVVCLAPSGSVWAWGAASPRP